MSSLHANRRGFTLIEVMVVVVIMGVLATLATYGVRKYILSARASEAGVVLNAIRSAQEIYRQDTFTYLDVSGGDFDKLHPTATPGNFKRNWAGNGDDAPTSENFRQLGVQVSGPVWFSYGVVAGRAGDSVPSLPSDMEKTEFNFPESAAEPFYVAIAKGDLNGNGKFSYAIAHSWSQEVYMENEGE